jgi:Protein of unknown function (DUF1572)
MSHTVSINTGDMNTAGETFLASAIKRVKYYKELGDRSLSQLSEADFFFKPNETSNSIAVIIRHMSGNMLSRWTNFLTEDGEKDWRKRDQEFEEQVVPVSALLAEWEKGWDCFFSALEKLTEDDLLKEIHIRSEPLFVIDAINRQLAHYPYHVGQIVYIARMIKNSDWQNLSIPPGESVKFNEGMKKNKP